MIELRAPLSQRRRLGMATTLLLVAMAGAGGARAAEEAAAPAQAPIAFVGETPIDRSTIDLVIRRLHPVTKPSGEQRMQIEASVLEQLVDEALLRPELSRQLV